MNAKKGFYNIFFGMLSQIVSIALGILIPRLVLINLGSESNGLLSSINQALVYLNLLEAGIGTATLQALYRPVAEHNTQDINQILSATNKYYKKVGTWYFIAVMTLALVFPNIIDSELSSFTIFSVVLLSGMSQVINFFFQGKYRILMQVEGKNYILTNLGTIINIFTSTGKIVLILHGFGIVALQIMYFAFNIMQMIYITNYIKNRYSKLWCNFTEKLSDDTSNIRINFSEYGCTYFNSCMWVKNSKCLFNVCNAIWYGRDCHIYDQQWSFFCYGTSI